MARRFYLISYDITDDHRRARVFRLLRGWGDHVQYSVFCCQLNLRELLRLKQHIKDRLNAHEDQTLVVDAGPVAGQRPEPEIDYVGRTWQPDVRTQIV